ncbi:hypothetical protein H8356DRAFT_1731377 [Neocallimastix lanati (nom. inval.)]|jgi:hypothetical protein|uniref:G-protein coupled receptors family 1 profile domain-containing protein n=1 Tax=Neocallimastix californiae TaxID=1754190 RepID=A0A1Y2BZS8_9FUNG|nr:hypothetical protein H8356DRAFT_1731377 [Neocallimastix sp. JGI-2020a]ORY40303.1 hypothetical protein LY90DRAFT_672215 [Neocallimastix californiae]|eukprot:ORY40303.1 hypothetical protein LY90DRAFT_672215 [Neocallimastix californiae]
MLIDALQNLPSYKREPLQARIVMTVIIMSDCIYLWYLVKCARKYKLTKDWRFFFPFIAALFAFANNFNDIVSFIISEGSDCKIFLLIFKVTALLNWTPISWLQTIRLMTFTKVFYSKRTFIIITVINVTLSLGYSICYYLNWGNFTEKVIGVETDRFMFCSPAQKPIEGHDSSFYTTLVMYFDLADSIFSFSVLVYTTYMALDNIKHLKFHHAKIKRMEEEGLIQLIVLTIGKISLYPIMIYLVKKQLTIGDIVWDTLSIIVIICAFRLVNVKYKRINVPDNDDDFI